LEPLRLQVLEQGDPVDAGGFHRHGGDTGLPQVVGDRMQVGGIGPEGTDLPRPDTDDVVVGVDVDAGGAGVLRLGWRWAVSEDRSGVGPARLGFQLAARQGIGYLKRDGGWEAAVRGRGAGGKTQSPERDQPRAGPRGVTKESGTTSRARLINGHEAPR